MTWKPVAGLLPLYLSLYDEIFPEMRLDFEPFMERIEQGLREQGIDVHRAPICCLDEEFRSAIAHFEARQVDLIFTLHLAYSPSLESVGALAATKIPVVILDTTTDLRFGLDVDPERISYNHGIHGVQDLANMLRRHEKPFCIVAGHLDNSPVLARAAMLARAAAASHLLRSMRVLRLGESFRGMGDFAVAESVLKEKLGVSVKTVDPSILEPWISNISASEIAAEAERDHAVYTVEASAEVHQRSLRVGLGLRALLEEEHYGAFSANFLAFNNPDGLVDNVPFLEASKAMARGLGYAGEGDVLTAALVGALNRAFGRVNFTEIFCPDWEGGTIFLSHMGEFNPACAGARARLIEKPFPFTAAQNPAILTAPPLPGPAVLVNLNPGPQNTFSLILAPVDVLGEATHPAMQDVVRGWFRPSCPMEDFLERYSTLGGTHHSALVHGGSVEALAAFATFTGIPFFTIS